MPTGPAWFILNVYFSNFRELHDFEMSRRKFIQKSAIFNYEEFLMRIVRETKIKIKI